MIKFKIFIPLLSLLISFTSLTNLTKAQIATGYEIGTWSGFKTAAVSYTFDDNCSNQLPVALPLFNQYKFNVTLFTVIDWTPSWPGLVEAANAGHEIASHTVSHPNSLAQLSISAQETELQNSQRTINNNVPNASCLTIAYPNCNIGDRALLQKYYIAGRTCSGSIVPSTPPDFLTISSIITGSAGSVKTANDFNTKVNDAKSSKGWCVFLTHGIDNDGGYSPTNSSDLRTHLAYMNTNIADFWVGTFKDVALYIKERNASTIVETTITEDSLQFTVSDQLDNAIYNLPISVRRRLPEGWKTARVYNNDALVNSSIVEMQGQNYVVFDVIPDQGTNSIVNGDRITSVVNSDASQLISINPNPFFNEAIIEMPGNFNYTVISLDGNVVETSSAKNKVEIGSGLLPGMYMVKILQDERVYTKKLIKN